MDSSGIQFDGTNFLDLGDAGDFDRKDEFSISFWIKIPRDNKVRGTLMAKAGYGGLQLGPGYGVFLTEESKKRRN